MKYTLPPTIQHKKSPLYGKAYIRIAKERRGLGRLALSWYIEHSYVIAHVCSESRDISYLCILHYVSC